MKDQSAIIVQQTSTNIPKLDHIDQVSAQISSNTVLILQHLQQLCSGFSQGRTTARVGHARAEKTADSLQQLSSHLERYGRRPIHLAVVLGLTSSVDFLIEADCALFTPPGFPSLLGYALKLTGFERRYILNALIVALTDRHTRLIDKARSLLPSMTFSDFKIIEGRKKERQAPLIREMLLSRGFAVPEALKLDDKSVYDVADLHEFTQMTIDVADALWSVGFEDIMSPTKME